MRRRLLVNLALALLVGALTAVLVLEPGPDEGPPVRRLTGLDPGAVQRIRIEPGAGTPFTLERRESHWWVGAPLDLPADAFRVEALLGVLTTTSHLGFRAAGNALASFGLEPPKLRMDVDGETLAFGATEPLNARRYVLYDGEVHLVDDAQYHHLSARLENFVHPSPLGSDASPRQLRLPGFTLERIDGRWHAEPRQPALGADARNAIADAWRHGRALRVSRYDATREWPLDVTVVTTDGQSIALRVDEGPDEVVMARPDLGVQWHFVRSAGERLLGRY